MKIAYLSKARAHIERYAPSDVEYVVAESTNGQWSEAALDTVKDAEAFLVGMEPVNAPVLDAAPHLKIVQRLGVGYETLDLAAAAERDVYCCNIEGVNKEAVAEHALTLLFALARQLLKIDQLTQQCAWEEARLLTAATMELSGKTLGILGLGNTGSELAKRARALSMNVVYDDPRHIAPEVLEATSARYLPKLELLQAADVVSIHADLNPSSAGMIDAHALAQMKPGALLICCARGGMIDEQALAEALNQGKLGGAGIDVFEEEPIAADNPLRSAQNCIITAHTAGATQESIRRIYAWAFQNIRQVVQQKQRPQWIRNGL